jgi:hypothetical protein
MFFPFTVKNQTPIPVQRRKYPLKARYYHQKPRRDHRDTLPHKQPAPKHVPRYAKRKPYYPDQSRYNGKEYVTGRSLKQQLIIIYEHIRDYEANERQPQSLPSRFVHISFRNSGRRVRSKRNRGRKGRKRGKIQDKQVRCNGRKSHLQKYRRAQYPAMIYAGEMVIPIPRMMAEIIMKISTSNSIRR